HPRRNRVRPAARRQISTRKHQPHPHVQPPRSALGNQQLAGAPPRIPPPSRASLVQRRPRPHRPLFHRPRRRPRARRRIRPRHRSCRRPSSPRRSRHSHRPHRRHQHGRDRSRNVVHRPRTRKNDRLPPRRRYRSLSRFHRPLRQFHHRPENVGHRRQSRRRNPDRGSVAALLLRFRHSQPR